jgi:Leucine-rich repeat (LRR) protein
MGVRVPPWAPKRKRFRKWKRFFFPSAQWLAFPRETEREAVLVLPELTDLDLSGNRLQQVPDLRHAAKLRRVSLRSNRITELPDNDDWLPASVMELDLAGNPIATVPAWLRQRAFSRLLLTGTAMPDSEARQLEREAEERWQKRPR